MFAELIKQTQVFAKANSSTILTGVGVAGTVGTALLTGRASIKAYQILEEDFSKEFYEHQDYDEYLDHRAHHVLEHHSLKDKVKLVWPVFIPPVVSGMLTITAVVFAHRISSNKAAALAAAYGLSERAFAEYREKVTEKIGKTKAGDIRDEIAQDRLQKDKPDTSHVVITGNGDVLCQDILTGRYFMTSAEKIRRAENTVNKEIIQHEYASLSMFYDELELEATGFSEDVGWNHEHMCEVRISATKTPEEVPCLAISFEGGPIAHYKKLY